ncbi:hypothetical protein STRDD11_01545 [Streptococcus sp. DD11]|uniref:hypothetical protein n=1 Tax=Streptococcus sp. DD11 TaxID=1777879 RepID=UPI000797FC17|nr:hypothetical protein [Streptococcus sp. DD11]KXT83348.1 hypothetical protein STRDD11_01545 [Streptococcus sp. DD11]
MFYNDEEKNKIAWQEYTDYKLGDDVVIDPSVGNDITIGYVSDISAVLQKRISKM